MRSPHVGVGLVGSAGGFERLSICFKLLYGYETSPTLSFFPLVPDHHIGICRFAGELNIVC